jgi:hypothetical protein
VARCRPPLILVSAVALAAVSLLAAGCGGGSSPGVATVASTGTGAGTSTSNAATAPAQNELVAFSRCMRSNGLPGFPDPRRLGGTSLKLTIHQFGSGNPHFQAAMNACGRLLPSSGGSQPTARQQRAQLADGLSFARCMRSHGVARFPDPTAQGQLTIDLVQAQGIDIHSPAVLHAVEECLPASHGLLTPAKVSEALRNAGG